MKIKCPSCGTVLSIPDSAAGKIIKCQCGKQLRAPSAAGTAAASSPANQASAAGGLDPGIFDELSDGDLQPVRPVNRPGVSPNPYQSPSSVSGDGASSYRGELASLGQRFVGALVDGMVYAITFVVAIVPIFVFGAVDDQDPTASISVALLGVAGLIASIPAIVNAVLITKRGQTLGKMAAGTRIVLDPSRELPGFAKGVLVRSFLVGVISQVVPFFGLIDVLFIFGQERKCLHDRMAGTIVINA